MHEEKEQQKQKETRKIIDFMTRNMFAYASNIEVYESIKEH